MSGLRLLLLSCTRNNLVRKFGELYPRRGARPLARSSPSVLFDVLLPPFRQSKSSTHACSTPIKKRKLAPGGRPSRSVRTTNAFYPQKFYQCPLPLYKTPPSQQSTYVPKKSIPTANIPRTRHPPLPHLHHHHLPLTHHHHHHRHRHRPPPPHAQRGTSPPRPRTATPAPP